VHAPVDPTSLDLFGRPNDGVARLWSQWLVGCAVGCLWIGIVVSVIGTHQRSRSPQFKEWMDIQLTEISEDRPGEDLAPGMAVGMMLRHTWWWFGGVLLQCGMSFTGALLLILVLNWRRKTAGRVLAVMFILACVYLAMTCFRDAQSNLRWRFWSAGAGSLLLGVAFVLSGVCAALSVASGGARRLAPRWLINEMRCSSRGPLR
jgi:hypothetical protein